MTPVEIVTMFRAEMHDTVDPPFWTDALLYPYLNDAQEMFARLTDGIIDSVSTLASLTYIVDDATIQIDERILKIAHAYRASDGAPVDIVNYADMETRGLRLDGRKGPVVALIIGLDETTAYLYPVASVADTLKLSIERMPLAVITSASTLMEIDKKHHIALLDRMKEIAYGNADAEVFNKAKAKEHGEKFLAYCAKAKQERERRRHKTRVVQYGGLGVPSSRVNDDYRRR